MRPREEWRLMLVILAFLLFYAAVGVRMSVMALSDPEEPRLGAVGVIEPVRGEITDRSGALLAANLPAWSLYAHPRELIDPIGTAIALSQIFPDLSADRLIREFTSDRSFVWVRRPVTPRQKDMVIDLGQPGLHFGARDIRLYPAGAAVAHVVGDVKAELEAVHFAEFTGSGGVERFFDQRLRDPALAGRPLELSLHLGAQAAMREVLMGEKERLTAVGAAGILMDVRTGEVIAMVSLPDFDPNRPRTYVDTKAGKSPRFNRAVQGVYELGSVFKPITAAMAIDAGVAAPETMIATGEPIFFGRQRVRDMHRMPPEMSVTDIIRRSSNVGSARLALRVTTPRFQEYLRRLGMFEASPLEISEAAGSTPLRPGKWTELSTMNIAFGHGLAVSPMHLAAAYATMANGGRKVTPTLVKGGNPPGEQVFGPHVTPQMMAILRKTVSDGTGRRADVEGYEVGGKTGTADKPREDGRGYHSDRVISTFAAVFPTSAPKYVLIVSFDEPTDRSGAQPNRQASRTAVPGAAEVIRRVAPILGLRPGEGGVATAHAPLPSPGSSPRSSPGPSAAALPPVALSTGN